VFLCIDITMHAFLRNTLYALLILSASGLILTQPPALTAAPQMSATPTVPCIFPTPPVDLGRIDIAPVVPLWLAPTQTLTITWSWLHTLTVTTSSGAVVTSTLQGAGNSGAPYYLPRAIMPISLVTGTNWLTLTAQAQVFNGGGPGCDYGGGVSTHTTDRDGNALRITLLGAQRRWLPIAGK
jgi:hypothetical protein